MLREDALGVLSSMSLREDALGVLSSMSLTKLSGGEISVWWMSVGGVCIAASSSVPAADRLALLDRAAVTSEVESHVAFGPYHDGFPDHAG